MPDDGAPKTEATSAGGGEAPADAASRLVVGSNTAAPAAHLARLLVQWAPIWARPRHLVENLAADPKWNPIFLGTAKVKKLEGAEGVLKQEWTRAIPPALVHMALLGVVAWSLLKTAQTELGWPPMTQHNLWWLVMAAAAVGIAFFPSYYSSQLSAAFCELEPNHDARRRAVQQALAQRPPRLSVMAFSIGMLGVGGSVGGIAYEREPTVLVSESGAHSFANAREHGWLRYGVKQEGSRCSVWLLVDTSKLKAASDWQCFEGGLPQRDAKLRTMLEWSPTWDSFKLDKSPNWSERSVAYEDKADVLKHSTTEWRNFGLETTRLAFSFKVPLAGLDLCSDARVGTEQVVLKVQHETRCAGRDGASELELAGAKLDRSSDSEW